MTEPLHFTFNRLVYLDHIISKLPLGIVLPLKIVAYVGRDEGQFRCIATILATPLSENIHSK